MSRSPQSITGRLPRLVNDDAEELPGAEFSVRLALSPKLEEELVSLMSTAPINASSADLVHEVEALGRGLSLVRERIGEIIFGQREVVEQALITLLCGGHALLIGVPGLAKTRLAETPRTIPRPHDKGHPCPPPPVAAGITRADVLPRR